MTYRYEDKKHIFDTDDGQRKLLMVYANIVKASSTFKAGEVFRGLSGSTWDMFACLDRLVELRMIREISEPWVIGQDREFRR